MNGWDFSVLWSAGRAILQGQSPYQVPNFFYPLPVAYVWAAFALLPQRIAFWAWISTNLLILIYFFRRGFWQWLLFVPVLHMLSSGQVEFFLWGLEREMRNNWRGAALGALITLKPQTAILLLSWHIVGWILGDRRTLLYWFGVTLFLWITPMLWYPNWIADWLNAAPTYNLMAASNSPGLFSLLRVVPSLWIAVAVVSLIIFIWGQFQSKEIARASAVLASPLGLFYSTMALLGCAPAWLLTPLSLLSAGLSLATKTFIPFILLPLAVLGWQLYNRNKSFPVNHERCVSTH
jgi:hypothetical protein